MTTKEEEEDSNQLQVVGSSGAAEKGEEDSSHHDRLKKSPWGVQLKKTPRGRNPVPNTRSSLRRLKEDTAKAEDGLRQTRTSLRKVNLPPRQKPTSRSGGRRYSRPSSRGWKLRQTNSPLLGVVLRKLDTIQEEEEYLDLDLMGTLGKQKEEKPQKDKKSADSLDCSFHASASPSNNNNNNNNNNNKFGVRLKPNRRRNSNASTNSIPREKPRRTYQIDLNPILEQEGSNFNIVSQSKSFLEVKLRPVNRNNNNNQQPPMNTDEPNPSQETAVELQLRHVVAPADGGPRKTVTEAVFQVPLLKPIPPPSQRKHWKVPTSDDPIQDLLQISLQNLKPTNSDLPYENQALQIQLKQVDPETRQVTTMDHVIDIALKQNQDTKETDDVASWAMNVQLQEICPHIDPPGPPTPACKLCIVARQVCKPIEQQEKERIILRHVKRPIEDPNFIQIEEFEDDSNYDWDDSQYDNDESEYYTEDFSSRSDSNVDVDVDLSDDENNQDTILPIEQPDEPAKAKAQKHHGHGHGADDDYDDDGDDSSSSSSSSSSSGDSFGGDDSEEEVNETEAEAQPEPEPEPEPAQTDSQQPRKVSEKKRRDLLMWYTRMQTPTKAQMKQKVAQLPESCDIKPEDVDALPWLPGGMFLNLKVMNQMFMEDWQGADKNGNGNGKDEGSANCNGKSEL